MIGLTINKHDSNYILLNMLRIVSMRLQRTSRCKTNFSSTLNSVKCFSCGSNKKPSEVKFDPEDEKTYIGFPLVQQRAANIIGNVTEKQMTRMLHVYCDYNVEITDQMVNLVDFFGNAKYLDITGCNDDPSAIHSCKDVKQYNGGVHHLNFGASSSLPFRENSFQIVSMLVPPSRATTDVAITEIVRILNTDGFALIGALKRIWEAERLFEQLQDSDDFTMYSLQELTGPKEWAEETYFMSLIRKK